MKHAFSFMSGKICIALLSIVFLGLRSQVANAQATGVVQNFDGLNINDETQLGYDGSPTLVSDKAAAGWTNEGQSLVTTGIRAWGISNDRQGVLFRTRYIRPGESSYIQFRLGAWGKEDNAGLDANDSVRVYVSIDSAPYINSISIIGRNGNQAAWAYTSNTGQSVGYTSNTVVAPPRGNVSPNNLSTIRIDLPVSSQSQSVRFYIIANNDASNELWTIDEVAIRSSAPLPVALKSFTAVTSAEGTQLQWATASEKDNAAFEVQRGGTAEQFQTIGRVSGQGTSSQGHSYSWVDKQPLPGLSYYRLRQLDYDGTESFSPVVVVQQSTDLLAASFSPNPSAGFVTLAPALGDVQYRVLNSLGQLVLTGKSSGGSTVDMQSLRTGSYFLELHSATGRKVERFIRE